MKGICVSVLALLLALTLAGCGQEPAEQAAPFPGQAQVTCRVVADQEGTLVRARADGTGYDVYALSLADTPVRYEDPAQTAIQPGDLVQVGCSGAVLETYPAQLGDVEGLLVKAEGFDDLCALYLTVLQDLWGEDSALNEGVVQLGLDLSQTRLSPAEQGALGVALSWQLDLPVLQGTMEELTDQGVIDGENLTWADGLLLSIREADPAAQDLTFTAEKWRGGLAAYLYTDCTAHQTRDGSWSEYTVGAHAIS